MCVCVSVCVCVCVCVCMSVCGAHVDANPPIEFTHLCIHAYMYVYICIFFHTYTRLCIYAFFFTHTHVCACMNFFFYLHPFSILSVYTHIYVSDVLHTCINAFLLIFFLFFCDSSWAQEAWCISRAQLAAKKSTATSRVFRSSVFLFPLKK